MTDIEKAANEAYDSCETALNDEYPMKDFFFSNGPALRSSDKATIAQINAPSPATESIMTLNPGNRISEDVCNDVGDNHCDHNH